MGHHEKELQHKVDIIRDHTTRVIKEKDGQGKVVRSYPALDPLLARVRHVVLTAAVASARPDGFSSTTPGNGSPPGGQGGRRMMRIVEHGEVDLVPTSATETAALQPSVPDQITRLASDVRTKIEQVAGLLDSLAADLDRFDNLRSTSKVPDPQMCWWAAKFGMPWDLAWEPYRTTDFANQLADPWPEPRKVSKFVYWFVRDHKQLPTEEQMLKYLDRGTVGVKA